MKFSLDAPDQIIGRQSWLFSFDSSVLFEAATKLVTYHTERLAYWSEQMLELDKQLKDSLKLREQEVTGGRQLNAVYDSEISSQYNIAKQKRDEHKTQKEIFESYAGVFKHEIKNWNLTIADVQFFRVYMEVV